MHQIFQTKKKLSNHSYVHWIVSFIVAIGLGYLFILIEFVKMHDRKVVFYNLKTANLSSMIEGLNNEKFANNKEHKEKEHVTFLDKAPVFFIYENKVIFGPIQSIVLPKPNHDVLVLNKSKLKNEFQEKISRYKNYSTIFPAMNIGIAFKKNTDYAQQLELMSQLKELVTLENQKRARSEDKFQIIPSLFLIETLSSK